MPNPTLSQRARGHDLPSFWTRATTLLCRVHPYWVDLNLQSLNWLIMKSIDCKTHLHLTYINFIIALQFSSSQGLFFCRGAGGRKQGFFTHSLSAQGTVRQLKRLPRSPTASRPGSLFYLERKDSNGDQLWLAYLEAAGSILVQRE